MGGSAPLPLGEAGTDGSLSFTLTGTRIADSVPRKKYEGPPLGARQGAKLVVADIEFLNDGQESVDIHCAFDLGSALHDAQDRQFDHVESLYEIEGNTDCNEYIQPGFRSTETIVFEIPADAEPAVVRLWDPNEGGGAFGDDAFGEQTSVVYDIRGQL